ncbi:dTDP-4-dehydrorhamnose 3,5-epimerase family protein [Streptomyces sp. JJ66]|uniref:dTDP-4-dehydrorhamnose 3,5-epimerase family protein n=1 Tax=Streptomyces sp. JJ66 TaxID=2803843 RepID=UPI001C572B23|nr:dTDP-4-dehydrorhamnose 3,5-epimerase family protein [Streptomyces sp. JJ66]MBW1600585.1 dTDP-4-dehydrorhamnose 3,5-epimerase family protein [Streptomyces sp. JJ66]
MRTRELAVAGAVEVTPPAFEDERGLFSPLYQEGDTPWAGGAAREPFRVARTALSVNRAGVVRGVHYTRPEAVGTAKVVFCPAGEVLDLVVDVREGSPTFGHWDSLHLASGRPRALYCPPGVGHAFVSLAEESVLVYLLSTPYRPEDDLAVTVYDPVLELPVPRRRDALMSPRDRAAPTLAEARARGLLPPYRETGATKTAPTSETADRRRTQA